MNSRRTLSSKLTEARFSTFDATARNQCMAPWIVEGDLLKVQRKKIYLPGDVIVVEGENGLLVHRLLGWRPFRGQLSVVTAGDASPSIDHPVAVKQVLGKVVSGTNRKEAANVPLAHRSQAILRYLGFAIAALKRRWRALGSGG